VQAAHYRPEVVLLDDKTGESSLSPYWKGSVLWVQSRGLD
jgi:hypothetical protein